MRISISIKHIQFYHYGIASSKHGANMIWMTTASYGWNEQTSHSGPLPFIALSWDSLVKLRHLSDSSTGWIPNARKQHSHTDTIRRLIWPYLSIRSKRTWFALFCPQSHSILFIIIIINKMMNCLVNSKLHMWKWFQQQQNDEAALSLFRV